MRSALFLLALIASSISCAFSLPMNEGGSGSSSQAHGPPAPPRSPPMSQPHTMSFLTLEGRAVLGGGDDPGTEALLTPMILHIFGTHASVIYQGSMRYYNSGDQQHVRRYFKFVEGTPVHGTGALCTTQNPCFGWAGIGRTYEIEGHLLCSYMAVYHPRPRAPHIVGVGRGENPGDGPIHEFMLNTMAAEFENKFVIPPPIIGQGHT
ncbi:hypothetical protein BDP27DRAFT_1338776 [Rhodocollybia butyracea]|uniref:Uncharacterized protein n=1 Tax=Rhodocollybia butyracea TaxID=206335 RepID=A0A9P5PCZ4_9AGAR|nr:hypothetical protein BDP27DRAFT_1338776 [Rhodocollybia butyracea]